MRRRGKRSVVPSSSATCATVRSRSTRAAVDLVITPPSPLRKYRRHVPQLGAGLRQERRRCAAPLAGPPPGSALRTPARHGRAAVTPDTSDQTGSSVMLVGATQGLPRLPIVQLAGAASRAALQAVAGRLR